MSKDIAKRQLATLEAALARAEAQPADRPWRQPTIDVLQSHIAVLKAFIAEASGSDG